MGIRNLLIPTLATIPPSSPSRNAEENIMYPIRHFMHRYLYRITIPNVMAPMADTITSEFARDFSRVFPAPSFSGSRLQTWYAAARLLEKSAMVSGVLITITARADRIIVADTDIRPRGEAQTVSIASNASKGSWGGGGEGGAERG